METSEQDARDRGPVDRVLDVALYAPLGLVLTARKWVPQLAAEGRRLVGSQLTAAQAVGRLAVDQGGRQLGTVTQRLARRATSVIGDIVSGGDDLDDDLVDDVTAEPAAAPDVGSPDSPVAGVPIDTAATTPAGAGLEPDPAHLPIPGYDTLSASQVVQRLAGLSADELEVVRSYELARRGRKTVLLKVAQLKAAT